MQPTQTPAGAGSEPNVLWSPTPERINQSNIARYMEWLRERRGLTFTDYDDLWAWSVGDIESFWTSIWEFFDVAATDRYSQVLPDRGMPGATWFPGATLNYAEHALRRRDAHPAVIYQAEGAPSVTLTYAELAAQVAGVAATMRRLGVRRGDRVAGYVANTPETVVAFLAAASIGAIWTSCAPEFGTQSVIDRFSQIEPTVLISVDGYRYNGKAYPRLDAVREMQRALPTLKATILIGLLEETPDLKGMTGAHPELPWNAALDTPAELEIDAVPFDHPLWILYSSGTTGLPKAIVQGHGGILLEHLKVLSLHLDLTPDDRFFWQTTTGWMMWNFLVSGLLLGSTILLYEGSPAVDDMRALWRFASETRATYFGTSAPFIHACMKRGLDPSAHFDLSALKGLGSTGSPLTPEGFQWVYDHVHSDLVLGSASGGTDVCTALVLACPILPVRAGELPCRALGAKVEAFDEKGNSVVEQVGELVVTAPLPSMPLYFWNDEENRRYIESYFDVYPGVWRHGDWIKITRHGSSVIYGRSDSTLNRSGIRTGTSDFYRIVERVPGVLDSLVVDTGSLGNDGRLFLFVVLERGVLLDDALRGRINTALRQELSPRHVPDEMHVISDVPRTLNGKKLEVPVRRILMGASIGDVVNRDAVKNPEALDFFAALR